MFGEWLLRSVRRFNATASENAHFQLEAKPKDDGQAGLVDGSCQL